MLHIYIARHGQDEDNANGILNGHRDMPLTELGKKQAKQLAQKIKNTGIQIHKTYSSPLQRAYITGKTITDILKIAPPEKMNLLIERDFGNMTGRLIKDVHTLPSNKLLKTDTITYFLSAPWSENFPQTIKRANKALEYIKKHNKEGNILITTHGDFGKMLYTVYYWLNWKDVLMKFHFGNSELLLLSPDIEPNQAHMFFTQQYNH